MSIILELGTTNYSDDRLDVKRALSHLETLCNVSNGYVLGEPEEKAGWTFFKLKIGPELHRKIEEKFSDMMQKYRWSSPDEKFSRFMGGYFDARGCNIRVKS